MIRPIALTRTVAGREWSPQAVSTLRATINYRGLREARKRASDGRSLGAQAHSGNNEENDHEHWWLGGREHATAFIDWERHQQLDRRRRARLNRPRPGSGAKRPQWFRSTKSPTLQSEAASRGPRYSASACGTGLSPLPYAEQNRHTPPNYRGAVR